MNIRYCAPFAHTWSTETHIARAFETLGHTVHRHSGPADLTILGSPGLPNDLLHHGPTISIHLDLYRGLRRAHLVDTDPMFRADHVFTPDGDPITQTWFASKGVNHHWMPPAVAHDETDRGTWRPQYDYDVVFVGSRAYHPEHPWRGQLIRFLERRYGERFQLFDHHPPVRDRDLNDLYATARVVVGDSLTLPGRTRYVSDRLMETLGRGGFLIFPRVPGLEELGFVEGKHLWLYELGDLDSVAEKVDAALALPETERRLVAWNGQRLVRARHTYVHRAAEILNVVERTVAVA